MIIRKLICPDSPRGFLFGGGAGSGSGSGNNNQQKSGTTFGVNGVSKSGSTATDAAIGFTSSEGSGEPGANFGGLSEATSSQVASAVAAAQAAQKGGGDLGAQQAAAGLSLAGQAPNVAASNAISDAGLAAQAAEAAQAQVAAAQATPDELSMGVEPFSSSSSALNVDAFSSLMNETLAPDLSTQIADAVMAENIAGEYGVATPDFSSLQSAPGTGLGSFTAPTGRGVLAGTQLNTAIGTLGAQLAAQAQAQNNSQMSGTPDTAVEAMMAAPDVYGYDDLSGDLALNPGLFSQVAPAQIGPPAAQMAQIGPNQTTDLSAMIDAAVAADNAYGVSPTGYNLANQQYVSPVQSGQTGQYTINGVPVSTQFAEQMIANQQQVVEGLPSPSTGLMGYMGKVPGLLSGIAALTGYNPTKSAAEAYGTMLSMPGAEVDAAGNITAPAGRGTLNYSQTLGGVTYSGMPDASYSGPFSGLVNPGSEPQSGESPIVNMIEEEPVVDPCPPGYALVDGVCQPSEQMGPVLTPEQSMGVAAAPMAFQPMYQPFQPQQINPFVLSPTGAALGRSV